MYKLFFLVLFLMNLNLCYSKVESECGEVTNLKIGGLGVRSINREDHPWYCDYNVVTDTNTVHCGAALISHEYIVTSPSCLNVSHSENLTQYIKDLKCGDTEMSLTKVIRKGSFSDDIMIFKIKKIISYSALIKPICVVEYESLLLDSKVTIVSSGNSLFETRKKAHYADITLRNATLCQSGNRRGEKTYCAGELFTFLRNGDIGSPMIVKYQNRHYLVGIANKLSGELDQRSHPTRFIRMNSQCDYFKKHTEFSCLSNIIPLSPSRKKVICGNVVTDHYHPWYCRLYADNGFDFCGGTLISNKYVLTAAHCTEKYRVKYVKCGIELQVKKNVESQPISYKKFDKITAKHDIAIIELKDNKNDLLKAGPICIPYKHKNLSKENKQVIAIGMNHNDIPFESLLGDRSLREYNSSVNSKKCIERNLSFKNENNICVESNGEGIKKGDSGSPLLIKENGIYYIIGILSKGDYDPTYNVTVSSYTRIQDYLDFITGTTKVEPSKSTTRTLNLLQIVVFIFIVIYF